MRATSKERWNCSAHSRIVLTVQTYDKNGTPDPIYIPQQASQPVVPETLGENAFSFVCDSRFESSGMPMPVSRDPVSAAQILAVYADGSEVSVLGMLLATLDPWKDEDRLHSLLQFEKPEKQEKLKEVIWNGSR